MNAIPDTNVWIRWFRQGRAPFVLQSGERLRFLLSSIALQELWAGAVSDGVARTLVAVTSLAREHGRLVNPPVAAWVVSGQVIGAIAATRRIGAARLRTLRNDVLLAATAVTYDATLLTSNVKDFALIAEFLPLRFQSPQDVS